MKDFKRQRGRGYFGIGILSVKKEVNTSNLWRSADAFGADFVFTIASRYKPNKADTSKATRHIPLFHFDTFEDFIKAKPLDCKVVGVECPAKHSLTNYVHFERSIYLLGAEDFGLPPEILDKVDTTVYIESSICLNVSVAGSIIMFDRQQKIGIKCKKFV